MTERERELRDQAWHIANNLLENLELVSVLEALEYEVDFDTTDQEAEFVLDLVHRALIDIPNNTSLEAFAS